MGKLRIREGGMNEEMDSNQRCKSDPTVVAMSNGNNSQWLSTARGALTENMWSPLVNSYIFITVLAAMPLLNASSLIN